MGVTKVIVNMSKHKREREREIKRATSKRLTRRLDTVHFTSFVHSLEIVVLRCELSVVLSVGFLFFFFMFGDFLVFLGDDIALAAAAEAAASI